MPKLGALSRLSPFEHLADHPCTDLALLDSDRALLGYMLQDVRALTRRVCSGELDFQPYETLHWDVHGLARRMVICDPAGLRRPDEWCVVGFFGERRPDADQAIVDDIEGDLLEEFRSHPGILSYSSMELVDNYWANLVIHQEPADTEKWRTSRVHVRAAEQVSPRHYLSVRIHNGRLPGGVIGNDSIVIERTKFWDYSSEPAWQGERAYA